MKYSMLFKHQKGVGLCSGETIKTIDYIQPLLLRLICLFKMKIEIDYFVKENFEGWKKEDYGTTKKVIPVKIFFRHFGNEDKNKMIIRQILKNESNR